MQNSCISAIETIKIDNFSYSEKYNDYIMHLSCCELKEKEAKSPIDSEWQKDYKESISYYNN